DLVLAFAIERTRLQEKAALESEVLERPAQHGARKLVKIEIEVEEEARERRGMARLALRSPRLDAFLSQFSRLAHRRFRILYPQLTPHSGVEVSVRRKRRLRASASGVPKTSRSRARHDRPRWLEPVSWAGAVHGARYGRFL